MTCSDTSLFLGVDGGGSGCRVAICDSSGETLARAKGGPANVTSDRIGAVKNLQSAIDGALGLVAVGDVRSLKVHMGLAGIIDGTDIAGLASEFAFAQMTISDDRLTSTIGALGSRNGVLVSVGTGSFVACQREGNVHYLGGWGLQIGDQASGAWLGQKLLERCVLASDGLIDPSDLTEATLRHFGNKPAEITTFAAKAQTSDYATFAPSILDAAEAQDTHACALLREGGAYLQTCLDRFALTDQDVLCLGGSLGPHYADWLTPSARSRIEEPVGDALEGALTLARNAATARR